MVKKWGRHWAESGWCAGFFRPMSLHEPACACMSLTRFPPPQILLYCVSGVVGSLAHVAWERFGRRAARIHHYWIRDPPALGASGAVLSIVLLDILMNPSQVVRAGRAVWVLARARDFLVGRFTSFSVAPKAIRVKIFT